MAFLLGMLIRFNLGRWWGLRHGAIKDLWNSINTLCFDFAVYVPDNSPEVLGIKETILRCVHRPHPRREALPTRRHGFTDFAAFADFAGDRLGGDGRRRTDARLPLGPGSPSPGVAIFGDGGGGGASQVRAGVGGADIHGGAGESRLANGGQRPGAP